MDKRGIIKTGALATILIIALIITLQISTSSAILTQSEYKLGDKVKLNLEQIENYKLKITTPSTSYLTQGSRDSFIFKPEEPGKYTLKLTYQEKEESYSFTVLSNEQTEKEKIEPQVSTQNNQPQEKKPEPTQEETEEQTEPQQTKRTEQIIINQPVKWKETIALVENQKETRLKIPGVSSNIKVTAISNTTNQNKSITPQIEQGSLLNYAANILQGKNQRDKYISLENAAGNIEIEYTTPAPTTEEKILKQNKKEITISSPRNIEYKNVLAFTDIPESTSKHELIKLYWKEKNKHLPIKAIDSDNNGLLDKIEWTAPSIQGTQTFEISIEILNVQSYPVVGQNWNVHFTTLGKADLIVTGFNGTEFGRDLSFLEITCDSIPVNVEAIENGFKIENYECSQTGIETSQVLTSGKHTLEFEFGDQKAYARNLANFLQIEWGNASLSACETWQTIPLRQIYTNPVVVATPEYTSTSTDFGISTWVRNVNTTAFQVRSSNQGLNCADSTNVNYIVVEQGNWTLPGSGIKIEAGKFNTTNFGLQGGGNWDCPANGETIVFNHTFDDTNPLVMSVRATDANQAIWATTFQHGPSAASDVNATTMCAGLSRSRAGTTTFTNEETIHYIVADTGIGNLSNIDFEIGWWVRDTGPSGGSWINGYDDGIPFNQSWTTSWPSAPEITAVGQTGIWGSDGSWPVLYRRNETSIEMFVDETNERAHSGSESGGGWAFQTAGSFTSEIVNILNTNVTGISDSSATILWDTNTLTNSSINYGTSETLGTTKGGATLKLNHSELLTGLSASTLYFHNITSCSLNGICNTTGTFNFTTVSGTPPTIFNITPLNNSNISSPVTLAASTSENATCEYSTTQTFIYGTGTDFTTTGALAHSTSLGTLASNTYSYYIKCEDSASNANDDSNQGATTFTVDAIAPIITLNEPIAGEIDFISDTLFNFTVSDNFASTSFCDISINDVTQEQNISAANGSSIIRTYSVDYSPHNWTVFCTDEVGNNATAQSWFFFGKVSSATIGEVGQVLINASNWTQVTLTNSFTNPVIVTGYQFPFTDSSPPVSVRMKNVSATSFEIMLQLANSTATASDIGNLNVTYLVIEQGFHFLEDGTRIEAYQYDTNTVSSSGNGWTSGDSKTYNHTYSASPIVLHQVMTYNDANWITTFASQDSNADNPPTTSGFQISLNGAEGFDSHASETVGYVVIEIANGTNDGIGYESQISGDIVEGVGNDPSCSAYSISFNNGYSSPPLVIESIQTMDGANGGWGQSCSVSTTQVNLRVDEDQFNDGERSHINEDVAVFVFESAGSIISNSTPEVPQITNVNATSVTDSSATIKWNTNISANSTVYYGLSNSSYSSQSSASFVLNHSITLTSLLEGTTYFYDVESCSQSTNTCNVSGTFNFTTGVGEPPLIFNITPINASLISNPVTLAASTSENANCEYSTTQTFVYGTGTDFTTIGTLFHTTSLGSLADGAHTYYIKCEDSASNANDDSNQGATTFTVDTVPPTITLDFPADSASTLPSTITLNWTATDNLSPTFLCDITINSVVKESNINVTSGVSANSTQTLANGLYNWNVTCADNLGNSNTSETRTFTVGADINVNVSTDNAQYNQGDIATISLNTTDLAFEPLQTNTTTDIILGTSLTNSSVWWNQSWQYRNAFKVQENSGTDLNEYIINITLNTQTLINQSKIENFCQDIRIVDSSQNQLDFYIQNASYNGCNTTQTKIWVKLNSLSANQSEVIYAYYGNNNTNSQSSEYKTFNYTSFQGLYHVVSSNVADVDIISFVDGNNVTNGTTYISLDRGNLTTLGASQGTIINATGPIFVESDDDSVDATVPISFASTEFVYGVNRNNDIWHVHSPYGNATVCVYDGEDGSGWTLVGTCFQVNQSQTTTVTRNVGGTTSTLDSASTDTAYINSTLPVLVAHDTDSPTDAFALYPPSTDLWGVPSTRLVIGVLEDSTTIQIYYSNGSTQNFNRDHGEDIYLEGFSTGGQDSAVHITANNPIGAIQEADQDGGEATTFLPEHELGTEYFIPQTASYIAVAATAPSTTCTLYDDTGSVLSSATTGSNARPFPNKWFYGPSHNGNNIPAGSRLECDQPVYAYYEQFGDGGASEERNLWSIKSFRKGAQTQPTITQSGTEEQFVTRNISQTDANGLHSFTFDTTSQTIGNYTVISLGERTMFNNGTGQTNFELFPPVAQAAPVVNLTTPVNNTFQNSQTISLFYNVTDPNDNIANATLILNGQQNITNQSAITNNQINNFTISLLDGVYLWTVNVTDLTNLEGTDNITRTFTIDTEAPNITLISPAQNESIGASTLTFNFTATDNLDTVLVCDLIIDSTVEENDFNLQNGSYQNFTKTLSAGTHLWNITCLDESTNLGTSETRNFTITEEPPTVTLNTTNNTYTTTGNLTLIYNATDNNGLTEAQLIINNQINQTNQTALLNGQLNNFTIIGFPEGLYLWTVNVTDTAGLNATALPQRTFTVDLNNPIVNLNLPADNTVSNSSSVSFNFTVTDTIDTTLTCDLYVGEESNLGFSATNATLTNRNIAGLTDGQKIWNVTCFDDSGRNGFSGNRIINITESPQVTLDTANNTFYNFTTFNLSYTPSDNTALSVCELHINGAFNQTNSSAVINNQQNNFTISGISEGVYTWHVACNDTIGLQNQSETRTFTVDLDGLNIDLLYPPSGLEIFSDTVEFSYNATDNIDPSLSCEIIVDSTIEDSFNATSGAETNRTVQFSSGGFKFWNVTCVDDSTNTATSETRNFTLAFAPVVTLNAPANNTFQNSPTISLFYDVQDDNNNIANATLILNDQKNITNQSEVVNEATNNFTISLPDGVYLWTVNVTDLTNLEGTDNITRTFTIDTTPPVITLNQPENNTIKTWNNYSINFTATDNIDTLLECNVYVNGALNATLNATNGTETLTTNILPDGNYLWNVTCADDATNLGASETFNFTIEAPPNVTLLAPEENHISNISSINFQYFVDDPIGITNCTLYINDTATDFTEEPSLGATNTFTVNNIADNHHNWTVECIDASPDFNAFRPQARNFTVDTTFPEITLNTPLNNTNTLRTVNFSFTALDNLDPILTCDLHIDGTANITNINAQNGSTVYNTIGEFTLGAHVWNVSCSDNANNTNWSQTWNFNATLVDLSINQTDISFNNTAPTENETVRINATVHNLINVTVPNIIVQFFDGDPDSGGIQIGTNQTISLIAPLSQEIASVNWQADLGTSQIFVLVDPPLAANGAIEEWNENNNEANNSIAVGGWQFVVGEITSQSEFDLADMQNRSVVRWPATNFESGNIYVTDSESIISWTSLQAIGKTTTDTDTSNDFTDIDTLLNMTNFADSVSALYLNSSGDILNQTTFTIFNAVIDEVPVTNSTNNTNFQTGLLWDTSDDTNTEFNTAEKEDLILITEINKNQIGAYGTYDYEIRIPARLREYQDTETRRIVFYTEIR